MHVHVLGQVAPRAGDALDLGLAAELAVGAHLARDARDLVGERRSWSTIVLMVSFSSAISPCGLDRDLLRQVAVGDRRRDRAMLRTWSVRLPAMSSRSRSGRATCPLTP